MSSGQKLWHFAKDNDPVKMTYQFLLRIVIKEVKITQFERMSVGQTLWHFAKDNVSGKKAYQFLQSIVI